MSPVATLAPVGLPFVAAPGFAPSVDRGPGLSPVVAADASAESGAWSVPEVSDGRVGLPVVDAVAGWFSASAPTGGPGRAGPGLSGRHAARLSVPSC